MFGNSRLLNLNYHLIITILLIFTYEYCIDWPVMTLLITSCNQIFTQEKLPNKLVNYIIFALTDLFDSGDFANFIFDILLIVGYNFMLTSAK